MIQLCNGFMNKYALTLFLWGNSYTRVFFRFLPCIFFFLLSPLDMIPKIKSIAKISWLRKVYFVKLSKIQVCFNTAATNHMLCLKMSSALLRIREPSGAEGRPTVPFNLFDNNLKTSATLAPDELRRVSIYSVKNQNVIVNANHVF